MAIHIMETCFVKPITPTKRQTLALSGLDLYWSASGYACTLHFYRTHGQDVLQFASIIRSLKQSLSVLLVDFYPVAGRLVEDPAGRLTLDCNDAGVEFTEARSDYPFGQLEAMDFAVQDFFPALTRTGSYRGSKEEDPVLSVQVTSFPGGGVAIGHSANHTLFDGFSFSLYMKCWAECGKGVPLSNPPCHMRRVAVSPSPIPDHLRISSSSSTAKNHFDSLLQAGVPALVEKEAVEPRMVAFAADMVENLKIEANGGASMNGTKLQAPFTTFECLAAHLWKARTKADKQQSDDDEVRLRFRVNLRQHLDPKLPVTYFGPAVIHAEVGATKAGELRRESLAATAGRIHEAISTYTKQEKIREEIKRYESERAVYGIQAGKQQEMRMAVMTEIVDTRRAGFYDAEFDWGELRAVRPAIAKDYAGVFTLAPPSQGAGGSRHGLEVILRLTTTETEALLPCLF